MLIPIDSKTAVKHKTKLADIKVGDLVSVEYEKPVPEDEVSEDETFKDKRQTKARVVNFIQSGVGNLVSEE